MHVHVHVCTRVCMCVQECIIMCIYIHMCSIYTYMYIHGKPSLVKWLRSWWHVVTCCRSCGKVFCGTCSDFFCQVPHEQLFEEVRVCEKCFYKLDGHLQQKSGHSQAPA